jgi:hypothetical protein
MELDPSALLFPAELDQLLKPTYFIMGVGVPNRLMDLAHSVASSFQM